MLNDQQGEDSKVFLQWGSRELVQFSRIDKGCAQDAAKHTVTDNVVTLCVLLRAETEFLRVELRQSEPLADRDATGSYNTQC